MVKILAGSYQSSAMVVMRNLRLPEFDKKNIEQQKALIFESNTCRYDMILGAYFFDQNWNWCQIQHRYHRMVWKWVATPWSAWSKRRGQGHGRNYRNSTRSIFFGIDWYDPICFAIEFLDAKYEKVQIDEVLNPFEYLSTQQKADLKQVLSVFTKLFDGTLGVYPHKKFHIELEPGAKPKHARPYPVPVIHLETF